MLTNRLVDNAGTPARPENSPAKVLIVDDHPAVREALAIRISAMSELQVCGEASGVNDALQLVNETKPDVAIIDISLKTGDGLDLIKRISARRENIRMLVWSMHSESLYAERALRAGALGYITKEQATDQIIDAIRQVLTGKVYLSPNMTEKLLHRTVGERGEILTNPTVESLSDREIEVLRLIGQGERTQAIARRLYLSVKTIETYRDRIRLKLDLADGAALARYAINWVRENP